MRTHLEQDRAIIHTKRDISMFVRLVHCNLRGMTGMYVDDSLLCGDERFWNESEPTLIKKFNSPVRKAEKHILC